MTILQAEGMDLDLLVDVEQSLLYGDVLQLGSNQFSVAVHESQVLLRYPVSPSRDPVGFETSVIGPANQLARVVAPYLQAMSEGERRALAARIECATLSRDTESVRPPARKMH